MTTLFANAAAVTQSWYLVARARSVPPGAIRGVDLGTRRIAVYRDTDGRAHAIDARCPHLGADLAQGTVEADSIRCAFHRWSFGPDGACREAPGHGRPPARRASVYPVIERWGCIWMFNGPAPLFDLPAIDDDGEWRALVLPSQRIGCHPHVVLANGLDLSHYETLHGMRFSEPPSLTSDHRFEVSVHLRGRPQSRMWRIISGTRRADLVARFTTVGSSLAWSSVFAPIRFHVIFTGRPDRDGRCITRTIFLVRRVPGPQWLRALTVMTMLLHDDRRVLDTIEFHPGFSDADAPLSAFARVVNELGSW
jgi:phenylpropionate dioxygenase-like ring-hydroxylating dioxygenase large terminal subunit